MGRRVVLANLEYMLFVDAVVEGLGPLRQWTSTGPLPGNSGLRVPRHLGLEHCLVT